MTKLLVILVFALIVEAVGVVCLSRGLKQLGDMPRITVGEVVKLVGRGAANRSILLGVALEAAFFATLLYLLSRHDVSLIWPLTALGFVITALAARFVLGEQVTPLRWAGVCLIVLGAALVSYGQPPSPKQPAPSPAGYSTPPAGPPS